jgi:hypothetical protein
MRIDGHLDRSSALRAANTMRIEGTDPVLAQGDFQVARA